MVAWDRFSDLDPTRFPVQPLGLSWLSLAIRQKLAAITLGLKRPTIIKFFFFQRKMSQKKITV